MQPDGYYERIVKPLTRAKHSLKIYEATGNRAAAAVCKQEIEVLKSRLISPAVIDETHRWDWLISIPKTDLNKMDTQGM